MGFSLRVIGRCFCCCNLGCGAGTSLGTGGRLVSRWMNSATGGCGDLSGYRGKMADVADVDYDWIGADIDVVFLLILWLS